MDPEAKLSCTCGKVRAIASGVGPNTVNRIVCYCSDCQAFLHQLRRSDLFDAHGGSDIVQLAPASLRIEQGQALIRVLRLSEKGLFRFYASCCNTPFGNCVPFPPFLGIARQTFSFDASGGADAAVGAPRGLVYGQHAVGTPPPGSTKLNPLLIARILLSMLRWRLRGQHKPHPYFDENKQPRYPVITLSSAEREQLRPMCGPRPA
jgi:hypothetical protein